MSNFARIGPSGAFSRRQITAQESSAAGSELFKDSRAAQSDFIDAGSEMRCPKMLQLCSRAVHAEQ
ncbi:hypothetical protein [Xanthomonas campestris]|uniref:hypothetical protein n=1 Tax=Xanthomonas campestris TaxID=339 RepID=UPI0036DC7893